MARFRALFATDLDGTLVDRDDGVHPRDREAIARAGRHGVAVTIATGRLTSRTYPLAAELALEVPLVCADGSVIACPASHRVLKRRPISIELVEHILAALVEHELSCFLFTHGAIHSCERGREHHGYVKGWSRDIITHADVLSAEAWRADPEATVMMAGIGPEPVARRVEALLAPVTEHVDSLGFGYGPGAMRVVRFLARGTSKATGLADVARDLGVPRERVCVIGDWYNDSPMFGWAARSFAMPHAPDDVKAVATDVLPPDAAERGGVAAALEAWLSELDRS